MQAVFAIRSQGFFNAIKKLKLSSFSPELQTEINQINKILQKNISEEKIKLLDALLQKDNRLYQSYKTEVLALKKKSNAQKMSKGFSDDDDEPTDKDLGLRNDNPPPKDDDDDDN